MEERTLTSRLLPAGERAGVSSARARTATRTLLARLGVPAAGVDDVVIVVTELVTNARRHAGGATGFAITARPGTGTVTVEVSDRVSRVPGSAPRHPDDRADSDGGWSRTSPTPSASAPTAVTAAAAAKPSLQPSPEKDSVSPARSPSREAADSRPGRIRPTPYRRGCRKGSARPSSPAAAGAASATVRPTPSAGRCAGGSARSGTTSPRTQPRHVQEQQLRVRGPRPAGLRHAARCIEVELARAHDHGRTVRTGPHRHLRRLHRHLPKPSTAPISGALTVEPAHTQQHHTYPHRDRRDTSTPAQHSRTGAHRPHGKRARKAFEAGRHG